MWLAPYSVAYLSHHNFTIYNTVEILIALVLSQSLLYGITELEYVAKCLWCQYKES